MAIARVQEAGNNNVGSQDPYDITISASTAGNFLVVFVGSFKFGSTTPAISDNIDGTSGWSTAFDLVGSNRRITCFYKENCPSGITTITITPDARGPGIAVEYSGIATSSSLDDAAGAMNLDTSTSWTAETVTASVTALVLGVVGNVDNVGTDYSAAGSFVEVYEEFKNIYGLMVEEQLNVSADDYTPIGTYDETVEHKSASVVFKAVAAGGIVVLRRRRQ